MANAAPGIDHFDIRPRTAVSNAFSPGAGGPLTSTCAGSAAEASKKAPDGAKRRNRRLAGRIAKTLCWENSTSLSRPALLTLLDGTTPDADESKQPEWIGRRFLQAASFPPKRPSSTAQAYIVGSSPACRYRRSCGFTSTLFRRHTFKIDRSEPMRRFRALKPHAGNVQLQRRTGPNPPSPPPPRAI